MRQRSKDSEEMSRHSSLPSEQLKVVEKTYELYPKMGKGSKVTKREYMKADTSRAFEVGARFHPTEAGKYFANKVADEDRHRTRRKTPEQKKALQDAFDEDIYPCTGRQIIISHQTGLEPKKVRVWFENRRARLPKSIRSDADKIMDQEKAKYALKMWRDYKENPEEMVEGLLAGTINGATGERQVDDVRGYQADDVFVDASAGESAEGKELSDDEAMEYALQSQLKTYLT